jgi:predicted nuclease of predicted toxin-antitoxin system
MLRFIVDTQLPPLLSGYFESKGQDSIHTTFYKDGHLLQDAEISAIAKSENRIIVTKDSDFLERYILLGAPPRVLLLQFGNIKNVDLINLFEKNYSIILDLFEQENNLVIFNREQIISY